MTKMMDGSPAVGGSTAKSPSRSGGGAGGSSSGGGGGGDPNANANGGGGPQLTNNPPVVVPTRRAYVSSDEKAEKWQLDLLMEKLKQKSGQFKALTETSKNIRQAFMERRCILDYGDKLNLQKSLDTLQQSIKVNSLQSMVERLEMVARQLGLKFTPGATGHEWFISSDMFYLELLIDPNGVVEDVKIQHDGKTEHQSCPEIVESLRKTDFVDFTAHLEGLVSIYHLNADKKIKSKAYIALQNLETDLSSMASSYAHVTDGETVVMKSLLGIFQHRKGGHPVKLVYYISPYEFLDVGSKSLLTNDVKTIVNEKLGCVATISIQASTSHKLQMGAIVNIIKTPDGKCIPRYGQLNATNSTALPACFVVNLGKPIPMCIDLLKTIQTTTAIDCFDFTNPQPILNLVSQSVSGGTLNCGDSKGLFVALPDQVHCYFMTETPNLEGVLVSSIAFTLASQLPQVLATLRQQLTFNTLVASCVRTGSKPELDCMVFEVNALSHQNLSVSFQHPLEDSLVTLEFDLRDVTHPHCRLHAVANATDIIPTLEEHACRVVQRSMSIPITLRAVIRRWQSMKVKAEPANPDFNITVGGSNMNVEVSQKSERSCGAESSERSQSSAHHNVMVPPGIMNFNTSSNSNSNTAPSVIPKTPVSTSSYSISPVNFPSQPPQNPMDILSYMNMNNLFNLSNQLNLAGTSSFPSLTSNMAIQMLASQMGSNPVAPSPMLMGLLDQVGQAQKRRKRKNTSDSMPSQSPSPSLSIRPNPSQSPSRSFNQKSPIRRQSDSSDGSGVERNAINLLMSELGMDQMPDPRWNIEVTPVNNTSVDNNVDDVDKKPMINKKSTPKRSLSLDSHSSEDLSGLQNLMDGTDFKPLITPSLSITPVSNTSSNVNSLLASIRPGIEIIPLPNHPVTIPNSITVTPILSKHPGNGSSSDRLDNKQKKIKDRVGGKRKLEGGEIEPSKPSKIPFLDSKGRMSPSFNINKKPSSPNLGGGSPAKPMLASQGKPSVSTLKSVSSSSSNSPKYPDPLSKQKVKKPNPKAVKNLSNLSIPPLKALSPDLGFSQNNKGDLMNLKSEFSKSESKYQVNQVQMANAAVTAALQQAAASLVANAQNAQKPPIAKKGGLAAVIDKLKSVHCSTDVPEKEKKEPSTGTMSTKDYLKVSSAITNDVLQQKKALGGNVGPGGNQEYMIKGGQGLKLTINKTKVKDPSKIQKAGILGLKSPSGLKKVIPGMKPLSALSAKLASVTKKFTVPKDLKDSLGMKLNSLSKGKDGKPRLESEDLTKKLFLPGAVKSLESGIFASAPIFDPNKFQIPKKSRSNPNIGSSSSSSASDSKSTAEISSSTSTSTPSSSKSQSYTSSFERKEKSMPVVPTPTSVPVPIVPVPIEVDAPAPELTAETSSSMSSSSLTNRSEPPALMEINCPIIPKTFAAQIVTQQAPEPLLIPEVDSTNGARNFEIKRPVESAPVEPITSEPVSSGNNMMDFASPESPDPFNCITNLSTPQNIPTTPLNPTGSEESPKVVTPPSVTTPPPVVAPAPISETPKQVIPPPEEIDDDQMVIDDCIPEETPSAPLVSNTTESKLTTENVPAPQTESSGNGNDKVVCPDEKSKSPEMPPPPPPTLEQSNVPVTSPAPILPPMSPKPVASPLGIGTVSVHIVHSPQPNSPALLRSPLIQASPAASPYAIDDDLMDEALIGGNSK